MRIAICDDVNFSEELKSLAGDGFASLNTPMFFPFITTVRHIREFPECDAVFLKWICPG